MKGEFDIVGFHAALDAQRAAQELTWKQVAEQSGVSASYAHAHVPGAPTGR